MLVPADDSASYSGRRQPSEAVEYVHGVRKLSLLARRYGFDALIVLAAVAGMLGVAFRRDDPDAPTTPLVVLRPGDRDHRAAAACAPPLPLRRARLRLARWARRSRSWTGG